MCLVKIVKKEKHTNMVSNPSAITCKVLEFPL